MHLSFNQKGTTGGNGNATQQELEEVRSHKTQITESLLKPTN
ncbi:MAG: hypothetical protein RH949_03990 [Coleofasciculus sp. A1-SPW-01]